MNVKKMFAALTGVLVAAEMIVPASIVGAATYSDELQGAYDYAYSKGITTMTSIDNANMYGELTRGQLSKMISQWAEKEMGVKADETASCSFSDASTAEGDLATWVVKACQMGLMGQGINAFRPNDKVTRGEFGTVLSRAIWGEKYNQENPFYAKHLQALKDAGIMTKIEEPNSLEIRGWVMLMLQRAAETVSGDDECNDPAVLLACALGSTGCPAKCADKASEEKKDSTRVIAGDLDVSVVDYSSSVKSAPQGMFVANTLKFNASEKIQLDSLTLKRTGLGSQKSISKVWLEKNGVAVTNSASVGSDGLAILNFKSNRDTISEATEYELVVELNQGTQYQGDEFAFELKSVESTAKNTTVSGTTTTYRISNYKVVELTARVVSPNTAGTVTQYDLGNWEYVIWEFSLESDSNKDDRDITVKSLTFRNDPKVNGSVDFADTFKNVKVYRDSKVVADKVEVNGKDITISLDKDPIKANRKAVYTIRAEVSSLEDVNKSVQLVIQNTRDIIADEVDTNFRTVIHFGDYDKVNNKYDDEVRLNEYTFKWGKVTFESTSNFPKTVNAAEGASDVTVAKGRIVVSEPVELPTINLNLLAANPTIDWATDAAKKTTLVNTVKRLTLKVGDKRYTSDISDDAVATFTDVTVRESADIELLVSLTSKIPAAVKEFSIPDIKWSVMLENGTYQNNDAKLKGGDIAWVIQAAKVQIKTPKFTLSKESVSTQETVINDSAVKTLMKGTLSAKDNDVNVNKLTVSLPTSTKLQSSASAKQASTLANLVINGVLATPTSVQCGTVKLAASDYAYDATAKTVSIAASKTSANDLCVAKFNSDAASLEAYLYINDKAFGNGKLTNGQSSYSFNSLGTIKVGENMPFEIRVVPTIDTPQEIYLNVIAEGTDSNGNDTKTTQESTATLKIKGEATMDIANSSSSDRVSDVTNGVTIYQGTLNVENGSTVLNKFVLTYDGITSAKYTLSNAKLVIDGETVSSLNVAWATTLDFNSNILSDDGVALSENVEEGKHKIEVTADVAVPAAETKVTTWSDTNIGSAKANYTLNVKNVAANGKSLSTSTVKTYFAKWAFTLSKTSTSDGVLTVKLTNTSKKTVKISGITVDRDDVDDIATASVNNQNVTFTLAGASPDYAIWSFSEQSVAAGDSIEIQLIAAKDKTAKLTWILYGVTDSWDDYNYALTSEITSIGTWWNFFSSK